MLYLKDCVNWKLYFCRYCEIIKRVEYLEFLGAFLNYINQQIKYRSSN